MSAIQKHHDEKAEKAAATDKEKVTPVAEITHEQVGTNGVELHVVMAGPTDGPPVVMCHGFPELWYSWRHQLVALGDAGYRAFAPDLRGYGGSSSPKEVADYGSDELTADLCGLLDRYGYEKAVFSGHDWGAMVTWEMGRLHPERVASIYASASPTSVPGPPTEIFRHIFGDKFFYMLYFQDVGPAEAEFDENPRRFVRTMLYSAGGEGMAKGPALVGDVAGRGHAVPGPSPTGSRHAARVADPGRRRRLHGGAHA